MQSKTIENSKSWNLVFCCWMIASISTLGSLFFSEVMEFPPCVLCWYQRIAMYPLVLLFLVGTFQSAKSTFAFTFPLALTGWVIALYHNLLHYEIVPESASPCLEGVSCSTVYIDWFGFITIPALSFLSFSLLLGILLILKRNNYYEK
ncbi:disulfide bond formation protein B [Halobacteriovorax marinus]|uniref:Disulfide bond formation protein B n=1 Tax=Halobacteriovorax marinus TaxID=97084 RepID=A0A1Y5F551_9BACT|nr:disulfide bond formation protein B [Halobacteriovorax marinus]